MRKTETKSVRLRSKTIYWKIVIFVTTTTTMYGLVFALRSDANIKDFLLEMLTSFAIGFVGGNLGAFINMRVIHPWLASLPERISKYRLVGSNTHKINSKKRVINHTDRRIIQILRG